ncbi:hypothetical protein ACIPZF_24775 [Pseudomonas sp. NPDC089752]|uniref:hypothetical protein n=1 Tax=Pseudomonas sp. NPDC089752 TaxID=3364472 RepID=UPI00382B88CA
MSQTIAVVLGWKIILMNAAGTAVFILCIVMIERATGNSSRPSLTAWIAYAFVALLPVVLFWHLGWNRATFSGNQFSLRAGFYQQNWPASILDAPWSTHSLRDFQRDNGVRVYSYAAGYFSRPGGERQYLLAIGSDQVRCLKIDGHPPLCLDPSTHEQILAARPRSVH